MKSFMVLTLTKVVTKGKANLSINNELLSLCS